MSSNRPRRSVLYMPGSNPRALAKGKTLGADVLILDLEDSVAPSKKAEARANILSALEDKAAYGHREILVRANGLDTDWGADDLDAFKDCAADGVILPKVDRAADVEAALARLGAGAPPIWCMIETARGVLRAEEIADSVEKLAGFVMGTADLGKEIGASVTVDRQPFLYALSRAALAARAAGIAIVDGVHVDLEDEAGFVAACRQGRNLGMDGKTLIHPKQIAEANRIFGPSPVELARAEKIIQAHAEAVAEGAGVVLVDGRLVESLHVEAAQKLIARQAMIDAQTAA